MILKNNKRIDRCSSDTVPIGTLNPFLGTTAPYGYLICQGQKVSKTTYKELYEICGDTFGQSTDTEFYLPDLRGQTIAGYKEGDSTFGTLGGLIGSLTNKYTPKGVNTGTAVTMNAVSLSHSGGAVQSHTLTIAEMPSHNHGGSYGDYGTPNASYGVMSNISGTGAAVVTDYTGGGGGHNHGFTQPSAHSFTPTTKSITQPTFTGTEENISTLQPTIVLNWIVKAFQLMPNQSYVSPVTQNSDINTYSCNYINKLNTYSTEEQIVGTWIDGKPIYRRVFNLTERILINYASWTDIINIMELEIDGFVDIKIMYDNIPWQGFISRVNGNILQFAGINRDDTAWYVDKLVLEYTKTTD